MSPESTTCPVCKSSAKYFAQARLISKYDVDYFRCVACGLVRTQDPFWLDDAYTTAISDRDIGMLSRCVDNAATVEALILLLGLGSTARFLDFAGGYGVFTRLMRDRGFDFWHEDLYCKNLFAKDFTAPGTSRGYALVTAFEVLEHLTSPMEEFAAIAARGEAIYATTQLVPDPTPAPHEWWYYDLESGQHVTFYTVSSLKMMAQRLGMTLITDGVSRHLFLPAAPHAKAWRVRLAYNDRLRPLAVRAVGHRKRRRSLLADDAAALLNP